MDRKLTFVIRAPYTSSAAVSTTSISTHFRNTQVRSGPHASRLVPLAFRTPLFFFFADEELLQVFHSKLWLGGDYPREVKRLHDKYGSVVRTGPNQLSYSSASSWKDIYGHVGGRKPFMKSGFYTDDRDSNIVSERDPHRHGVMRRTLSHGFSAKALTEQEDLVQEYVDKLISQINIHATGEKGTNMVQWYNFTTFDIIGDLAFGDPFGCLDEGLF